MYPSGCELYHSHHHLFKCFFPKRREKSLPPEGYLSRQHTTKGEHFLRNSNGWRRLAYLTKERKCHCELRPRGGKICLIWEFRKDFCGCFWDLISVHTLCPRQLSNVGESCPSGNKQIRNRLPLLRDDSQNLVIRKYSTLVEWPSRTPKCCRFDPQSGHVGEGS